MPSDDAARPAAAGPHDAADGPAADSLAADGPDAGSTPFAPRRLHPASIVLGVQARQAGQALIPPIVVAAGVLGRAATAAVVVGVLAAALTWRVLAWQRFTYAFDGTVLRIEEGVLHRTQRSIDVARIQQVEVDRSLLQRLLGVAVVRLETASDAGAAEVALRVVDERAARSLGTSLRTAVSSPGAAAGDGTPASEVVVAVPLRHVALAAVTGSRLLVVPALVLGVLEWSSQLGSGLDPLELLRTLGGSAVAPAVLLALAATMAVAAIVGLLRDGAFRMERVGDDLHVRRGLLATREATVPLARVQLVAVERSWIRRPLRVAALQIHSAGGTDRDAERRIVVPLVTDDRIDELVRAVLPGVPGVPDLLAHPPAARRRLSWGWTWRLALLAAVPTTVLWPVGAWVVAAVPPVAIGLAVAEHRLLGHARTDRLVASRHGVVSTATQLVPLGRVQGVARTSTPLQRRLSLASVLVHVAGPGRRLEVDDAAAVDATRLWNDLRRT